MTGASVVGRAARGARVLLAGQVLRALTQFTGLVVLSRLLVPEDFGAMVVAAVVVGIGDVLRDLGLSVAAVRQPSIRPAERSALFVVNALLGLLLAGVVFALAPVIARIVDAAVAEGLLKVVAITFVLNGLSAQFRADLNRTMRYRILAVVDAVSFALATVLAIVLAAHGAGVWALAAQVVASSALTAALFTVLGRWAPARPTFDAQTQASIRFGANVAASQAMSYVGNNIDSVVLAVTAPSVAVGLYNRAFQCVMAPLALLRAPLTTVAVPSLSRLLSDQPAYERFVLQAQASIGYLVVPPVFAAAAAAQPLVAIVLGPGWEEAVPVVALLALAAALQQLSSFANWVFAANGDGAAARNFSLVATAVRAVLIIALAGRGPVGVALGYLLSVVLLWPLAVSWACRSAQLSPGVVMGVSMRPLVLGGAAFGLVWIALALTSEAGSAARLALAIGVTGLAYGLGMLAPRVRREILAAIRVVLR